MKSSARLNVCLLGWVSHATVRSPSRMSGSLPCRISIQYSLPVLRKLFVVFGLQPPHFTQRGSTLLLISLSSCPARPRERSRGRGLNRSRGLNRGRGLSSSRGRDRSRGLSRGRGLNRGRGRRTGRRGRSSHNRHGSGRRGWYECRRGRGRRRSRGRRTVPDTCDGANRGRGSGSGRGRGRQRIIRQGHGERDIAVAVGAGPAEARHINRNRAQRGPRATSGASADVEAGKIVHALPDAHLDRRGPMAISDGEGHAPDGDHAHQRGDDEVPGVDQPLDAHGFPSLPVRAREAPCGSGMVVACQRYRSEVRRRGQSPIPRGRTATGCAGKRGNDSRGRVPARARRLPCAA